MRNAELAWLDVLLEGWRRWPLRDCNRLRLPPRFILHRVMTEGATAAAAQRTQALPMPAPQAVEATEAALAAMPGRLCAAIKARCLHLNWPTPQCARELGMGLQGFCWTLDRAQWWLAVGSASRWLAA